MIHTLKITNGAKILAASLLTIPEQFVTPPEILRAAHLHEALTNGLPSDLASDGIRILEEVEINCTEAQRELLKKSVESNAKRILISPHSVSLLTALGF